MKNIYDILKQHWGYSTFRPLQEEIINSVCNGRDTVALLPTGGGKSLCFQVPALALDGICIVISPIVALMADQVSALKNLGIKAINLSGGLSSTDLNSLLENALYGNYKFLYLSPERLQQEIVKNYIRQMKVNLIAIDEAHCISQWGNDFRPTYKNVTLLRDLHPLVPIMALTATATPEVLEDTIHELRLEKPKVFKASFYRPNLSYQVVKENDKIFRAEKLLKNISGSAIVYVRSRKSSVEISAQLNSLGITADHYHGGLPNKEKNQKLEAWKKGNVSTIVATNAFGMGIDNPNVRLVIHLQVPESIESYFQEAGRAGRDGNMAAAVLLFNDYDKIQVRKQFLESLPDPITLKKIYRHLNNYFQIPYGEGEFSKFNFNFSEFCNVYSLNSQLTYNALQALDRLGIVQLSQEFGRKSILQFLLSSKDLLEYFERDMATSIIGKTLLRMYGGIFEMPTAINLDLLSAKTGQNLNVIIAVLHKMQRDHVIQLDLQTTDATLTFLMPREDDKTINVISREVQLQNKKKEKQVLSILGYIDNNQVCRSIQLVNYFGEDSTIKCGICSVCKAEKTQFTVQERKNIAKEILILLEGRDLSTREICENLRFAESEILKVLRVLVDNGKIGITPRNRIFLK